MSISVKFQEAMDELNSCSSVWDVYVKLRTAGATGSRSKASECPVAHYLCDKLGLEFPSPSVSVGHANSYLYEAPLTTITLENAEVVRKLIERFDSGRNYQDLKIAPGTLNV